jgi:transposase
LWQNLAKALEKCVAAHRACLAEPPPAPAEEQAAALPEPEPAGQPDPTGKYAERTRRHHELVRQLRAEGRGLREIARHLGWGLHTVQRLDRAATWQELADGRWQGPRPSKLDPFKPYPGQHADGAHGSIRRLFLEIQALGYDGSYPVVRDYLARNSPAREREPLPPAPPTVRDVTNWLCRRPGSLTEDEKPRLKAILDRCPELQAASDQVRGFATMITELTGQDLPQWMAAALDAGLPGISSFAKGLEQDLDAVTNGLTMNWSSGPVEGRVNHIKMIKRQMFGRAGLPLLRKRVLLTAARALAT